MDDRGWKREEVEPVLLEVRKFTVNSKPTCMASYGHGGRARMACRFISTSLMGSQHRCLATDKEIRTSKDGMLEPVRGCPAWEA